MQYIFDSLSEFGRASKAMKKPRTFYGVAKINSAEKSWDGGLGFDGTCDIAMTGGAGWTAGVKRMISAKANVDALKSEHVVQRDEYDVVGHTLDVTDYLTGVPDCWDNSEEQPRPLLKVGVQLYTPGGNDIEDYINRGAALMSVLDDVIAQGVDVELWGCVSGKHRVKHKRQLGAFVDCRIRLKGAEHAWSPSAVAFGLCHPAVSRRLGFNVAECTKGLQNTGYFPGHSLDYKDDEPDGSDFDLWIGYNDMLRGDYSNPKRGLSRITELVNDAVKAKVTNATVEA